MVPGTFEASAVRPISLNLLAVNSKGQGYDRILICNSKDASQPLVDIGVGEWSSWIFLEFPYDGRRITGSLRFKLFSLGPDGQNLRLLRSLVYPATEWTYPESLAKELISEVGPYIEFPSSAMKLAFGGFGFDASDQGELDTELLNAFMEELLALMDEVGIEKGLIGVRLDDPRPTLDVIEKYSNRFFAQVGVNPFFGMPELEFSPLLGVCQYRQRNRPKSVGCLVGWQGKLMLTSTEQNGCLLPGSTIC